MSSPGGQWVIGCFFLSQLMDLIVNGVLVIC